MLPEILDISRGCFLSVTDSLLRIIGRIAESCIVVKRQKIALFYYIKNIQHIQHLNQENLTKKQQPVKALQGFGYRSSVKLPEEPSRFLNGMRKGPAEPPLHSLTNKTFML